MLPQKIVIFVAVLLLTACGYHLRGTVDLPENFNNVYLEGGSATLREQFRKVLRSSSARLVTSVDAASLKIRILDEDSDRRVLSLSSRGRSNELELYYRLEYEFANSADARLMAPQPLEIRREYFNNQQDILAKSNEETVIRNEMYVQAVQTVVDRARAVLEANTK